MAGEKDVTTPAPHAEKSLLRLLAELSGQVAALVLPMFFITLLPPPYALLVVLACALAMWLSARLGYTRFGRGCSQLMSSAVFGLGFSTGRALPDYWDIAAPLAIIVAGLACVATWERRLGLVKPAARPAGSAWGSDELQATPEGEPLRTFNHGEIAMGGPTYCDYLFPDGVLLQGLGSSARFSADGRYFAAPVPSRYQWGLVIFDRTERCLYHCIGEERFWELDEFTDNGIAGRHSPLVGNTVHRASLGELLASAEAVQLLPAVDLWLEPGAWQKALAVDSFQRRSPDGRQLIEAQLYLPARLRELADPTAPLRQPHYQMSLNGQPTGLLIGAGCALLWSPSSRSLLCVARKVDEAELAASGYWLWQVGAGWRALPAPWVASEGDVSLTWADPVELYDSTLWVAGWLDYPQPECGHYGYQLHSIHSDTQIQIGHDAQGRARLAPLHRTTVRLALPLGSRGGRGAAGIESEPLRGGERGIFSWQFDDETGKGAFRCRLGDWQLPGLWQLDHRVSDCARYLALVPYTRPPAMPGVVVVADSLRRRLLPGPTMLVARLLDFRAGYLSLARIPGRLDDGQPSTPLRRFNQAAPPAGHAWSFCQRQENSRLYHDVCRLRVESNRLCLAPHWRQVHAPQAAVAAGDFVQPAGNGNDAAWLFGLVSEYDDSWLRANHPRRGGYLLTATGIGISNLAPSLIWSADGRYLALTRLCIDTGSSREGRRAWQLLLVDVPQRSVRCSPRWLHNLPCFEGFTAEGVRVRLFSRDWEDSGESDPGAVLQVPMAELLALPAEPLQPFGGIWLAGEDEADAPAWQALDKSPLLPWLEVLA